MPPARLAKSPLGEFPTAGGRANTRDNEIAGASGHSGGGRREWFTFPHLHFTARTSNVRVRERMSQGNVDAHLLVAILKIAREECSHNHWAEMEPILAAAWDDLRDAGTPPWDLVAEEIQRACRREGFVAN